MIRPTLALAVALLVIALAASVTCGQQLFRTSPPVPEAAPPDPMAAARGVRHLLRNGMDFLAYQDYERALDFLRAAEARQNELSPSEVRMLKQGIESAQRGMREAADAPRPSYARTSAGSRPGAIAFGRPAQGPVSPAGEPIQLASSTVTSSSPAVAASHQPVRSPAPLAAGAETRAPAVVRVPPATALEPAALAGQAAAALPVRASAPLPASPVNAPASVPAGSTAGPMALPPLPADLPDTANPSGLLASSPVPGPIPEQAAPDPLPRSEAVVLPPLPSEPASPSAPPEPLSAPATAATGPMAVPMLPLERPEPGAPANLGRAAHTPPAVLTDPGAAAPPPVVDPAPAATYVETRAPEPPPDEPASPSMPLVRPTTELPDHSGSSLASQGESSRSLLSPRLQREVEKIAQAQEEAARRERAREGAGEQPSIEPEQPTTRLELPRAPSPTEARPLRAIPVPDEFVPLAPRQWEPSRKYWAAAATCHSPLYFQDAALERYGHSVEQFFGPVGRCLTYPIDDPTQSKQRNQILQPFFSAGLMAAQIVALPYNMIVDPPWEAEYDLGYYRPGDRIPTDIYYLPWHGVGPPLRGMNY